MSSRENPSERITRRGFVRQTAASSFLVMAASPALGSQANSRIKTGVVGLGGRGRMIATMLRDHGGYEITAVADYFAEISQGSANRSTCQAIAVSPAFQATRACLRAASKPSFLKRFHISSRNTP